MSTTRLRNLWDMLQYSAHSFVALSRQLGQLEGLVLAIPSHARDAKFPDQLKNTAPDSLKSLRGMLESLDLPVSVTFYDSVMDMLSKDGTIVTVMSKFEQLQNAIEAELKGRTFLSLTPHEAKLFAPPSPLFEYEVQNKFPSASYEIEESGMCLGLGRSTASVFHLMRISEIGIRAISKCLAIPDPVKPAERNWGSVLAKIKAAIDAKNASRSAGWSTPSDREFFESVYASLDAIRNAWRNTTMHVENKYTPEEAEHIFAAVKSFMRKLASRLDEQGLPLA